MTTWNVSGLQDSYGNCTTVFAVVDLESLGETDEGGGSDGYYVILYDGNMNPLSADDFQALVGAPIIETIAVDDFFEGAPVSRPFHLIAYDIDSVFPGRMDPAVVETYPVIATTSFDPGLYSAACAGLPMAGDVVVVVEEPVPGCDMTIAIPATAVGATITADTPVYWTLGETSPETFPAGLTVRALGVDATGMYTKVLYVCGYYWVPTSAIGPNFDAVWNGAPLPTGVVE